MARYEGLITSLKENGLAEVIIQPGSAGIPWASPDVNSRVCHCASDGSTVILEATNMVGAAVGDYVAVIRSTGALLKNAGMLVGIPVVGLLTGVGLALSATRNFTTHMDLGVGIILAGLIVGILVGVVLFRGRGETGRAVIERIIKPQKEVAELIDQENCPIQGNGISCEGCQGPL